MRHYFLVRHQRTDLSDLPSPEPERVWGWLATLVLGVVAAVVSQLPALAALILFHEWGASLAKLQGLAGDGVTVIILLCVSTPIQVGLLVWFARLRAPSALDYLALTLPSKRDITLLIFVVIAIMAAGDGLNLLFGTSIVTPFETDIFSSARTAGALPWLWLSVVLVAPIGEETLFRGFLFRGWEGSSSSGPWIAIGATAFLWAILHVQYDVLVIGQVLLMGLAFGWVRWVTGSTVSTILLHVALNAVGLTETYFTLRG
jgi:membrane protease YdiL (CAAX protease family)